MKIKNALISTIAMTALSSAPLLASAGPTELTTINNTGLYSSVQAPMGCSGQLDTDNGWSGPGHTNPAPTPWAAGVAPMCYYFTDMFTGETIPCEAELYFSVSEEGKECQGFDAGKITLTADGKISGPSGFTYQGTKHQLSYSSKGGEVTLTMD